MSLRISILSSAFFLSALGLTLRAQSPAPCAASQLREAKVQQPNGGAGHAAHQIVVTNRSRRSCTLHGAPQLAFLDAHNKPVDLPVCANCNDYLFPAAPVQTVTLAPGASAYLLIGFANGDVPGLSCAAVSRIKIVFADSPLSFPLFRGESFSVCSPDVTAWRPGLYRDPTQ